MTKPKYDDNFNLKLRQSRVRPIRGSAFEETHRRLASRRVMDYMSKRYDSRFLYTSTGTKQQQREYCGISYSERGTPYYQPKQWQAHARYLMRKGANNIDDKGYGFNETEEGIHIENEVKSWEKDDLRMFKFILSPEQGSRMDLVQHTKDLFKYIETVSGYELEWIAIDHYDTAKPHVHVVVRGVDKAGKEVRFSKDQVRYLFRDEARRLATKELGYRLKKDILESRDKIILAKHVTEIDREILRRRDHDGMLRVTSNTLNLYAREKNLQTIKRLEFLQEHGLVHKKGRKGSTWIIPDDFIDRIQKYQVSQDIIKAKYSNKKIIIDHHLPIAHKELKPNDFLVGRVSGLGVSDEIFDKQYMLIEGVDGKLHHINMTGSLKRAWYKGEVELGDTVYLNCREFKADTIFFKEELKMSKEKKDLLFDLLDKHDYGKRENDNTYRLSAAKIPQLKEDLNLKDFSKELERIITLRDKNIQYVAVESYKQIEDIVLNKKFTNLDRQIVKWMKNKETIPEATSISNTVRSSFISTMTYRVKELQKMDILSQSLDINYITLGKMRMAKEHPVQVIDSSLESIKIEKDVFVKAEYPTNVDFDILRLKNKDGLLKIAAATNSESAKEQLNIINSRLDFLHSKGFVNKQEDTWIIKDSLIDDLKINQSRIELKHIKEEHLGCIKDDHLQIVHTQPSDKEVIIGKIAGLGNKSEKSSRDYLLIEAVDGKLHHINMNNKVRQDFEQGKLKTGEYIHIEGKSFNTTDSFNIDKLNIPQKFKEPLIKELVDSKIVEQIGPKTIKLTCSLENNKVKEVLPEPIRKELRKAINRSQKTIQHYDYQTYKRTNDIIENPTTHAIDKTILKWAKDNQSIPKPTSLSNKVRDDILDIANERVRFLKDRQLVNDKLDIDYKIINERNRRGPKLDL